MLEYNAKAINSSNTTRSTTDPQPQMVNQVKIPFRFVPVVPPKKDENGRTEKQAEGLGGSSKYKSVLDLNLTVRRPLSPSSTSSTKANREQGIQRERRINESSKNDSTEFESIDERSFPVLTDNCDEPSIPQLTVTPSASIKSTVTYNQRESVYAISQVYQPATRVEGN